ncbi:hypothetical protein [Pararhizobium gei]|uniref:hypothetical protein n=1 Tax=Pararhizobium gei TaxID=1395951 RepID=UPI0023DCBB59|nr:hypothetical protein [Rhizobium gei]
MKKMSMQHFLNEKASLILSKKTFNELECTPTIELKNWLDSISIRNGYLLSSLENQENQINSAKEYMDSEFAIEIHLNKIHLEDDYELDLEKHKYIGLYFYICCYMQQFLINKNLTEDVILWYSTDCYNENEEYPSHTASFALVRTDKDLYPLETMNYKDDFHIGTRISLK